MRSLLGTLALLRLWALLFGSLAARRIAGFGDAVFATRLFAACLRGFVLLAAPRFVQRSVKEVVVVLVAIYGGPSDLTQTRRRRPRLASFFVPRCSIIFDSLHHLVPNLPLLRTRALGRALAFALTANSALVTFVVKMRQEVERHFCLFFPGVKKSWRRDKKKILQT